MAHPAIKMKVNKMPLTIFKVTNPNLVAEIAKFMVYSLIDTLRDILRKTDLRKGIDELKIVSTENYSSELYDDLHFLVILRMTILKAYIATVRILSNFKWALK